MAIASGFFSMPGTGPRPPKNSRICPFGLKICTLLQPESTTYRLPNVSTATPFGLSNSPQLVPSWPNVVTNFPSGSNFCTREFSVSLT